MRDSNLAILAAPLAILLVCATGASAAVLGPYAADADTLFLYHFDETAGASDPGNPFVNTGTKGAAFNLTNTGGPDGRDNTGAGGYGGAAWSGFGSSFDVYGSGSGSYHSGTSSVGGGANTVGVAQSQADFQGAAGQFTYEALIKLPDLNAEYEFLARDNSASTRGFLFRTTGSGELSFYPGSGSSLSLVIPTSGPNAFVADEWFHVAVSYDGNGGSANNLTFYWTRVDPTVTQASVLGTATLPSDVSNSTTDFYIGTQGRAPYRFEAQFIDEVRISSVVRGAGDFIFGVPEPSTAAMLFGLGAVGLLGYPRRRKQR